MSREETETPLPSSLLFRKEHAFIPTITEMAGLLAVSLAILGAATILPIIRAHEGEAYTYITTNISDYIGKVLARFEGPRWATAITAVVWMFVGMGVYLGVWAAAVLIHAYKNDIPPTKGFIVPDGLAKKAHFTNTLARVLVRTFGLVGVVVWTVILLGAIFPECMQLFIDALTDLNAFSVVRIIGSLLLLAFGLYVVTILFRLIALKRRVFGT